MHATYSQLEIPVYVAKIATYNWAHQMLVDILSTQVGALAQPLIVQVHMIAKEAHMTALIAINTVLKEFNSVFILIPGVIDEIPKFREAWRHLEQQIGAELFPYAKAIRHQEAARVTPSAFPMLASAALYHTTETSTIMKNYRQGHPIPGSIPETKLVDVFHQKLKRKSQSTFTDEQWAILNSCRKLHRIWSRLHFSHLQLHWRWLKNWINRHNTWCPNWWTAAQTSNPQRSPWPAGPHHADTPAAPGYVRPTALLLKPV